MAAPKSVQQFREIVRSKFLRGINEDVDNVLDGLLVWVVDDAIKGRVTTEEAAALVGDWLARNYGLCTVGHSKRDSDGFSKKLISRRRR